MDSYCAEYLLNINKNSLASKYFIYRAGLMLQFLITPIIFGLFASVFGILWLNNQSIKAAGYWAVFYVLVGAGFLIENIIPKTDAYTLIRMVGDFGYIFGTLCGVVGLIVYFERKLPLNLLVFVSVSTAILTALFWFPFYSIQLRSEIISYGCSLLCFIAVFSIYPAIRSKLEKTLFCLLVISAFQYGLNSIIQFHVFNAEVASSTFNNSFYLDVLNFSAAIVTLAMSLVFLAMITMDIIAQYRDEANRDSLTSLKNRKTVEAEIDDEIKRHNETGVPFVLMLCDIDHFKKINDQYGHLSGDRILKSIAKVLRSTIRETDMVGRYGGEEFILLIRNGNLISGRIMAEKLRALIAKTDWELPETNLQITASFGLAEIRQGEDFKTLFKRADEALYLAKAEGRNRVCGSEKFTLKVFSKAS